MDKVLKEIANKFGASESSPLSPKQLSELQSNAFSGTLSSEVLRPICWRIFMGVISTNGVQAWVHDLQQLCIDYADLKQKVIPKVSSKVTVDPLSALLGDKAENNEEWDDYYKVPSSTVCYCCLFA